MTTQDTSPSDLAARSAEDNVPTDDKYLRTEFLQRLAHDLRGPAGVIHGALQELELSLGADVSKHAPFLAMARRGLRRILHTADRLSNSGQLERGTPTLDRSEIDLRTLIRQATSDAETIEGRKKIAIQLELPDEPVSCSVDPHWLNAALFELASNAIRNAQKQVSVRLLQRDDASAHRIEISFEDDGKPCAAFGTKRFQTPGDRRGLGLGLAIVHDVVAAHGGSLEIAYGGPNAGASFGVRVGFGLAR